MGVVFPDDFRVEALRRDHPRKAFDCGEAPVDDWLRARAFQHQTKHLSTTTVLISPDGHLAGFYTLATGQIDFGELPATVAKSLPRRTLPVAVLAWLGIDRNFQGRGLGKLALAQALRDCHEAGKTFAFIAVIVECLNENAKAFYQQWNFRELPGHPLKLFLSSDDLAAMMSVER